MTRLKRPWRDNRGRLSPLKLGVFAALFVPGLWTGFAYAADLLGARPLNDAIHQIGLWGYRFLLISLAITPLRRVLQLPPLLLVRRMIGVAAFAYIAVHFTLYTADQMFDLWKVGSEIVLRFYLAIGFTALLGLAALAATSTDAMVRRLGRKWQKLHRLVYLVCVLGLIHYSMQSKLEQWEPTIADGIFVWLMGYRLLAARFAVRGRLPLGWVTLLGAVVTVLTGLGEALYFNLAFHVDPLRVLPANFSLDTGVRPAVVVFGFGLLVLIAGLVRDRLAPPARTRPHYA